MGTTRVIVIRTDDDGNMMQLYPRRADVREEDMILMLRQARHRFTFVSKSSGSYFQVTNLETNKVSKVNVGWNDIELLADHLPSENGLLVLRNRVPKLR